MFIRAETSVDALFTPEQHSPKRGSARSKHKIRNYGYSYYANHNCLYSVMSSVGLLIKTLD